MGLFSQLKKGKREDAKAAPESGAAQQAQQAGEQPDGGSDEPVFYEESGGVTKAQAIELLQGASFPPGQPIGVAGGEHGYGAVSYPGFLLVFFHQDKDHPMRIEKRTFMTREAILNDAAFYTSQGDFHGAADCIWEAVEQNQGADEH